MIQEKPDREAFERVCKALEGHEAISCKHIIDVFGWPAVELFIIMASPPSASLEIYDLLKDIKSKLKEKE